jgi:GH25 family lysozyme M1 (1,4-beta-N-acetylmuramidase)
MAQPKGVDVAGYQATSFDVTGLSYAFVKVTEGTTYLNPNAAGQVAHTRSAGLLPGTYHFQHTGSTQAQAEYFVAHAAPKAGDMLACDWETDPATGKHPTSLEKDAFIKAVKKLRPNNKVGLYCNLNFWTSIDVSSYCGDFLWIADPNHPAGRPNVSHAWMFHQYSISGGMDRDVANFNSAEDLNAWAKGSDDVALTDADIEKVADAVFTKLMKTDGVLVAGPGEPNPKTNPFWAFQSYVQNTGSDAYNAKRNTDAILVALKDPAGFVAQLEALKLKITIGE